jgi:N-acetylglutamate synthase-like GNAT family acetyltransferase
MVVYENNTDHLTDFIRLNEEWINKYFVLENVDKELAKNPAIIIDNNGFIFSIVEKESVIGVCALFNEGNGVFQLARMAVSPSAQGKGYGTLLMETCLKKARTIKARRVYLASNTKLTSAIELYKKSGFTAVNTGQKPTCSRANIIMELSI